MDYSKIIDYHREKDADLTIAAQPVDYKDASRFDIIEQQEDMKITNFFKEH
jgi:glucose-1-phosphate adenylyltransferase